ncbi:phage tail protein [Flexibacterium corallicola]|uniref:phage tail protein n=1 Tax=Flexibacterium corallicola TaxID=3037259 RepID=UPI00286F6177|nr:phage tail protein [Pseudovibrio sp. M1P-2-3]
MAERMFPETLIPPGINDERSRAILGAVEAMAKEFDFSSLLMRTAEEMPRDVLELALHDNSLEEFVSPDGLPEIAVRRLIDHRWALHEKKGTDNGVKLGQELLGITPSIEHWWQQEPEGHHDTHQITIYVNEHLFEGEEAFLNAKIQNASLHMVDATKRWSQGTQYQLGAEFKSGLGVGNTARAASMAKVSGQATLPKLGCEVAFGGAARSHSLAKISGETALPQMRGSLAFGASVRTISFLSISGELQL